MKVYGMDCVCDEMGRIQRVYIGDSWCNIYRACVKRYWNGERMTTRIESYDRETPSAQQFRRWIKKDMVKFC